MGASGLVGFGKLCQISQSLAALGAYELPLIALDPVANPDDIRARLEKKLRAHVEATALARMLDSLVVQVGTPQDLSLDLDIGWALEAIPEDLRLKDAAYRELFARPGTPPIVSSTTSAYTTRDLFGGLSQKELGSVLHPFFPHHKNPIWEFVTTGSVSSENTLRDLDQLMMALGFDLVQVADVPAFAADRIFCGLMLEAVRIVEDLDCLPGQVDAVCQALLGCTPFRVHNMIRGANRLSRHCMELCHQEHPSTLFALPELWRSYCDDPGKQWDVQCDATLDGSRSFEIKLRIQGMLACLTAYLLHHNIIAPGDLDRLCTRALGFNIGPCSLIETQGSARVADLARTFLDTQSITLAQTVAPLQAIESLGA